MDRFPNRTEHLQSLRLAMGLRSLGDRPTDFLSATPGSTGCEHAESEEAPRLATFAMEGADITRLVEDLIVRTRCFRFVVAICGYQSNPSTPYTGSKGEERVEEWKSNFYAGHRIRVCHCFSVLGVRETVGAEAILELKAVEE